MTSHSVTYEYERFLLQSRGKPTQLEGVLAKVWPRNYWIEWNSLSPLLSSLEDLLVENNDAKQ